MLKTRGGVHQALAVPPVPGGLLLGFCEVLKIHGFCVGCRGDAIFVVAAPFSGRSFCFVQCFILHFTLSAVTPSLVGDGPGLVIFFADACVRS